MAGSCITAVKFIGVSSLGLLTGSLTYQTLQSIPELIKHLSIANYTASSTETLKLYLGEVEEFIIQSRFANGTLAALAGALLTIAYKYSPSSEQHPYLLYAAFGAPLTLAGVYYNASAFENRLLQRRFETVKKVTTPAKPANPTNDSDNESLSKSYIHVDEESSANTTPLLTVANSPKIAPEEPSSIDQEVEVALAKKLIVRDLEYAKSSYIVGTAISGVSFLIGVVGFLGDYFFL